MWWPAFSWYRRFYWLEAINIQRISQLDVLFVHIEGIDVICGLFKCFFFQYQYKKGQGQSQQAFSALVMLLTWKLAGLFKFALMFWQHSIIHMQCPNIWRKFHLQWYFPSDFTSHSVHFDSPRNQDTCREHTQNMGITHSVKSKFNIVHKTQVIISLYYQLDSSVFYWDK